MRRVGWLVAHPPREKGFFLSSVEVVMAAELQLEAADGVAETPFITVKVTINEEHNVIVEGFQVRASTLKHLCCMFTLSSGQPSVYGYGCRAGATDMPQSGMLWN